MNAEQTDNLYNSFYAHQSEAERHGKIRKLLADFDCAKKSVLEIGAGHGNNIPLLISCGFKPENIFVNEIREDRIDYLKLHYPEIHIYEGNAINLDFKRKFDMVFQSTVFTSILSFSERRMLASVMWALLKPRGIILWYDFIYNNPRNPLVKKVSKGEVIELFPKAVSSTIRKVTLAPPVGRRVGKLYNVFNLPFLRSHILALFQKP